MKNTFYKQLQFNFSSFLNLISLSISSKPENRILKLPFQLKELKLNKVINHIDNIIVLKDNNFIGKGIKYLLHLKKFKLNGLFDKYIEFPKNIQFISIHSIDINSINTSELTQLTHLTIHNTEINELDLPLSLCELNLIKCKI